MVNVLYEKEIYGTINQGRAVRKNTRRRPLGKEGIQFPKCLTE